MVWSLWYHVLLELLPGCFWETSCWFGCRQLALRPPQPLEELLQLSMETFSLQTHRRSFELFTPAAGDVLSCKPSGVSHLLQSVLQQFLTLLGLQQQTPPVVVQLIQLVPQVAGLVTWGGLQQLRRSAVHRLHRGVMGEHVVTQDLGEPEGKRGSDIPSRDVRENSARAADARGVWPARFRWPSGRS